MDHEVTVVKIGYLEPELAAMARRHLLVLSPGGVPPPRPHPTGVSAPGFPAPDHRLGRPAALGASGRSPGVARKAATLLRARCRPARSRLIFLAFFPRFPIKKDHLALRVSACHPQDFRPLRKDLTSHEERCFAIFAFALPVAASAFAMASSQGSDGYTLLIVPDRYNTPALTTSRTVTPFLQAFPYEFPGNPADPFVHAWNNGAWTQIPTASFNSGEFLRAKRARTIVVGEDNAQTRALIDTASAWSPQVLNAPAEKSAEMLNTVGRALNFSRSDYRFFASRHGFEIEDLNAARRKESWYDQPRNKALSEVDPKLSAALEKEDDASAGTAPLTPSPARAAPRAEVKPEPAPMRPGPVTAKPDKAATE
ncbi:MAG: hypothetical protein U1F77_10630 [Kiritimatiellia bacterium]